MTGAALGLESEFADAACAYRVIDAARTDAGLVRARNEDALVRRPDVKLWAVADGMGGHDDGAWAAGAVARALDAMPVSGDFQADCGRLSAAVGEAHTLIRARAERRGATLGSTVTALLLNGPRFAVLWVGDSRAYRLRAGRLAPLTQDHTQVQAKVERGLMSPQEARAHPMAHVLTQAVGAQPRLEPAGVRGACAPGDLFLLCSDGVHGVLAEAEIAGELARRPPAVACEAIAALCHARGAPDNLTLIAVACAEA